MNTLCENPLIWNFDDEQKKEKKEKKTKVKPLKGA